MTGATSILAIVGPTASGKTDLALKLAVSKNAELISVDSRQIYKHLSVGTAKPEGTWTNGTYSVQDIPYHLLDIWDPARPFSAADFVRLCTEKISEIQKRGKQAILVGGTGLYFKALSEGLAPLPPADPMIRARLKREAEEKGRAHLHHRLSKIDPEAALKIPANNIQRLIRALEVFELTGKPISEWHKEHSSRLSSPAADKPSSPTVAGGGLNFVGIDIPRPELVKRIERRSQAMIRDGMVEETKALLERGYGERSPALTGLGYPRILSYLKGILSKDECLTLLIQDTRQYAKRQMTWFRHQLPVQWNA